METSRFTRIDPTQIDNTEQFKQLLVTLHEENIELKKAIEFSYDGIWITDGNGLTLFINTAIERITGLTKKEVIGKNMESLVGQGVFDKSASLEVLKEKKTITIMQTVITGIKTIVTGTPVFDDEGNLHRVISNVRDITELNHLRKELEKVSKERLRYQSELNNLKMELEEINKIIFKSKKMKEIVDIAIRVANFDTTILLQGESGVGKEVVAQLIHDSSPRKNQGAFIKVNCSTLPESLLESELFGYVEGAFTGAKKGGKPGLFELAEGGTILLDEIGELPLSIQAKFLRVLQEMEIMRLGGEEAIQINVRIIAASNQNITSMVDTNKFRKDLYYRLNVVSLNIPPLRDRKEDISTLTYHFQQQLNEKYQMRKKISPHVLRLFIDYSWPGNVRELKNIIERLFVTTTSDTISISDLPEYLQENSKYKQYTTRALEEGNLKSEMNRLEKEIITEALSKHETTYSAANALGISQSAFVRKTQKHKINRSASR